MKEFRFEKATHTYYYGDEVVPGFSQIMRESGLLPRYKGTAARDKGTRVHDAIDLYNTLGVETMDPELLPYLQGWKRFLESYPCEIIASEKPVFHQDLWYAGTLDVLVRKDGRLVIIDLKSGSPSDWHGLQLAAYALALETILPEKVDTGIVVYVTDKGKYKTRPYLDLDYQKNQWIVIVKGMVA